MMMVVMKYLVKCQSLSVEEKSSYLLNPDKQGISCSYKRSLPLFQNNVYQYIIVINLNVCLFISLGKVTL